MILGISLERRGVPLAYKPMIFVSNHVSYLDIVVLGACVDGTFIAKSEISSWPVFGHLGRLVGTFFVRRYWRCAKQQLDAMIERLAASESFVLFGEGTSSNGLQVLPFKSSLMGVLEPWRLGQPVLVQPVTLIYRQLKDGRSVDQNNANLYAWYGACPLIPHLLRVMRMKGVYVTVVFGNACHSWQCPDRKRLAGTLRDEISRNLSGETSGEAIQFVPRKRRKIIPKPRLWRKKKEAA